MPADFLGLLDERVLILDGAMGTNIHRYHPTDADWGGAAQVNNCDYVAVTHPEWIYEIHKGFLEVGCDAVETNTFNGSKILGGAASQALSDLYVPGQAQGLHPVIGRVVFNLARDAGFNLVHEFWPDVRKKLSPTRLGKLFFW